MSAMATLDRRRDVLSVAVRNARRAAGLNQKELAELVACHKGTVSNLERGIVETDEATIRRIESVLDLDLSPDSLYREGTVTLLMEEVERKFREVAPSDRVLFVSQMIAAVVAWQPPARHSNGDGELRLLARAQYERTIRAVSGISEAQVAEALSLFDAST